MTFYVLPFLHLYQVLTKIIILFQPNFIKIPALRGFMRDVTFSFQWFLFMLSSFNDVQKNDFN